MEISNYIIKAENGNRVILFNTLTTALITIDKVTYKHIFIDKIFDDNDAIASLKKMGFIVDSNKQQLEFIEALRKREIESPQQTITIFTTNKCNARCYYCFEKGIRFVDMSMETAQMIVDFILKRFHKKELAIMWFGGEPLLSVNIIEYITQCLRQHGYTLNSHITTNGSLINKPLIDFLKQNYEHLSFQITIDDIGIKYGQIKRYVDIEVEDAFDKVINNCKLLLNNDIPLSIRINYRTEQIDKAKNIFLRIKDIFKKYEGEKFRIYLAAITMAEGCNSCREEKGKITDLLNAMKFAYSQNLYNPRAKNERQKILSTFCLLPKSYACGACKINNITIDAEGYIFKCHRFVQYPHYRIGSVFDGINKNTKHCLKIEDFHIFREECKECNILPLCQQGCFAIHELYEENLNCEMKEVQSDLLLAYYKTVYGE